MQSLKAPRTRLAVLLASGLGLACGAVLGTFDSPAAWYYVAGASLAAIAMLQALRPGVGLRWPSPSDIANSPDVPDAAARDRGEVAGSSSLDPPPANDRTMESQAIVWNDALVLYAHADRALVRRFLDVMRPRLSAAPELERADFALVCVTPTLLASRWIADVELSRMRERHTLMLPVALEAVDIDRFDLHGFDTTQIFRYEVGGQRGFAECRDPDKSRFCDALVAALGAQVREHDPRSMSRRAGDIPSDR